MKKQDIILKFAPLLKPFGMVGIVPFRRERGVKKDEVTEALKRDPLILKEKLK